jgi:glycerol-3-phosphate cytidylyltransferase-like family protein
VDTRNKILNEDEGQRVARQLRGAGIRLRVVTGFFDPVLAAHARRLAELAAPNTTLMVVVNSANDTMLDARSRAELLAALRTVDYVVVPGKTDVSVLLQRIEPDAICREEDADRRRTGELAVRIRERRGLEA